MARVVLSLFGFDFLEILWAVLQPAPGSEVFHANACTVVASNQMSFTALLQEKSDHLGEGMQTAITG